VGAGCGPFLADYGLEFPLGAPFEDSIAALRLVVSGMIHRYPRIRVIVPHLGGTLPFLKMRLDGSLGGRTEYKPSEYLKSHIIIDTMVFSNEGLRHLVAEAGVGQIVYGTDVPFNWPVTVDLVLNASFLSDADKEAILGGNLIKLLRVS